MIVLGGSRGTVGFVELPNDVRELIDNYRPSPIGPAATLGDEGIETVRVAVRTVNAESKKRASLLLSHTARHVALAVQRGVALETMALFSPREVQRSIEVVAAGTGQVSPFSSNLRRVARAVTPSAGHLTALRVKGADRLAPYSRSEQVQLEAIAAGMNIATAASYRRGLALGLGAGASAGEADAARSGDVVAVSGGAVLRMPGDGRLVGVEGRWADLLLDANGPSPRLTDSYDRVARQRLSRELRRASGCPDYSSHRLRTTWICDLLARDLPVAVIAKAAGLRAQVLVDYLAYVAPVKAEVAALWLSGEYRAVLNHVVALPEELNSGPATSAVKVPRRNIEDVISTFTPDNARAAEAWSQDVVTEIEELVRRAAGSPERARQLLTAASGHLEWALRTGGVPLTTTALFKDTTVDRAIAGLAKRGSSAATVRSRLRALSVAAGLHQASIARPATNFAVPYGAQQLDRLDVVLPTLGEREQRYLQSMMALGLGVGASNREAIEVRGVDVVDREALAVRLGDRTVFATAAQSGVLRGLRELGDECLIGGSREVRELVRRRVDSAVGFPVKMSRLRTTWLVQNLRLGVPLRVLAPAAGTSLLELGHLVSTCISVSDIDVVAWTLSSAASVPSK